MAGGLRVGPLAGMGVALVIMVGGSVEATFDGAGVTTSFELWSGASPGAGGSLLAAFSHSVPAGTSPGEVEYQPPSLARTEWEHINRVLTDCGGNISEAARRLGLHRRTLQRKRKTLPPES